MVGFRDMDAVIPAAGRGSRRGGLTADRPKGLIEIAGRPLLAHVFETAVEAGANELIVVVGYEAAQIVDRFGDTFEGVSITYVHQRERLGLGHAVLQAEPHVDGTFLLLTATTSFPGVSSRRWRLSKRRTRCSQSRRFRLRSRRRPA